MPANREIMSPVDTAWLRMESPANLMMIGVVLVLENAIDVELLKSIISTRLVKYDRFRQRVEDKDGTPHWADDPYFNVDNHIHLIGLPGKGGKEELQQLISDLDSTPLDFSKPLWQVHVIDKYQGGTAVMFRVHHAIADGISLVRVMLSMTDETPEPVMPEELKEHVAEPSFFRKLIPSSKLIKQSFAFGQELLEDGWDLISQPQNLIDLAKEGVTIASEVTRIAALPADPPTCFKGTLKGRKRVAWAESLPLPRIRTIARSLGATINDVLLTAATGAIREYLLQQAEPLDIENLHVAVPFNLRPLDKPVTTLGNQFGLVIVALPVGEADPQKRFEKVKTAMETLKKSYQAHVFYGLLGVLGKGPSILEQTALEVLSKKASLVMTNVPGPQIPLYLAGSKILQPMVWVPQSGEVGVGLSILSYNGEVQFGVVADENLIPQPELLVDHFLKSYSELNQLKVESTT